VRGAAVTLLTPGGRQLDRVVSLADGAYVVAVPSPGTCLPAVSASSHGARAAHVSVGGGAARPRRGADARRGGRRQL